MSEEYTLDNGLQVVLVPQRIQITFSNLRINHGAYHQLEGEEGIAHFLEHCMAGGGGRKCGKNGVNYNKQHLGNHNYLTSRPATTAVAGFFPHHSQNYFTILADLLFEPELDEETLASERQRVIREISKQKRDLAFQDHKIFFYAQNGEDMTHPQDILGDIDVVVAASETDLRAFHSRGFKPNNMLLTLSGAIPNNIHEVIEASFGQYPSGPIPEINYPTLEKIAHPQTIHTSAPELINLQHREQSNANITISTIGPSYRDPLYPAASVGMAIFGGDIGSVLMSELSFKRGLAYNTGASIYVDDLNLSKLNIVGDFTATRIEESLDLIFQLFNDMKNTLVPEQSLDLIREKFAYNLIHRHYDDINAEANDILSKRMYGFTTKELFEAIKSVTAPDVQDFFQQYLPSSRDELNYVALIRDPLKH